MATHSTASAATGMAGQFCPPTTLNGGRWETSHVQGIAVDLTLGHVYYSFTTVLVKTDLGGVLIGTVEGFTGHLGDIELDPRDGRVYGSLEYKDACAFYIAIFEAGAIDRVGLHAANERVVQTVHLAEVTDDYGARVSVEVQDGMAVRSGRYGCSGIDGIAFGPRFGSVGGEQLLSVAYGIHSDRTRADNDHQIVLQYSIGDWDSHSRSLIESSPHRSGPHAPAGKYFVRTGNTTFGVQNLEYDASSRLWLMGVYPGVKAEFPNYTLFAIEAECAPRVAVLQGLGDERGMLLALADAGLRDGQTGIRGWHQKADVGMEPLGGGLFYLAASSRAAGLETCDLTLYRWTGARDAPFAEVVRSGRTAAPAAESPPLDRALA